MKFHNKTAVIDTTAVVEAFQLPKPGSHDIESFIKWAGHVGFTDWISGHDETLEIEGPEGVMVASPLDWIIKDAKGAFHPCKPDMFATMYEEAMEASVKVQEASNRHEMNRAETLSCVKGPWLTQLTHEEDDLLESIASRYANLRDPATCSRNGPDSVGHANMLAALQELQNMWKLNVSAAMQAERVAVLEETKKMIDMQWLSEHNRRLVKHAIDRLKSQPAAAEQQPDTDAPSYKRMFKAAVYALGLINEALGIDLDEAGGAGPILDAIEALKASRLPQ